MKKVSFSQIVKVGLFIIILVVITGSISINNKPNLWQAIGNLIKSSNPVTYQALTSMPEMQSLLSNIPEEAVYAYIQNGETYPLSVSLYPVSDNSKVMAHLRKLKDYRSWNVDSPAYKLQEMGNLSANPQVVSIRSYAESEQGINYPSTRLEFGTFSAEDLGMQFILTANTHVSYTFYVAMNTYDESGTVAERKLNFVIVSTQDMVLLEEMQKLCSKRLCMFPTESATPTPEG